MPKNLKILFMCAIISIAFGSATVMADEPVGEESSRRDVHSFGVPEQIKVEHLALDLAVDFAKKELRGSATLRLRRARIVRPAHL